MQLFVLLTSIALASAAAIHKRQSISFTTTCNAASNPSWTDCQSIFSGINSQADDNPDYEWQPPSPGEQDLETVWTNGNCAVSLVFYTGQQVAQYYLVDAVNDLQTDCEVAGAGGLAASSDGLMGVSVYAADQNPSKKVKRTGTWTNAYTIQNAAPSQYRQQVLDGTPGGSSWSLTSSDTQTNQVETSASVTESLFDSFSATESISYTYTQTVTTSTTENIPNNCATDQTGYLYWYPLFTQYHGGFSMSGPSPCDIYVPDQNSDGSAAGTYQVVCSS